MTRLEKRISDLQVELMKSPSRDQRKEILDELLTTEWSLEPIAAATNRPWMEAQIAPLSIREMQSHLRADELLLEFVLDEPTSFAIVISRDEARLQQASRSNGHHNESGSAAIVASRSDGLRRHRARALCILTWHN
jgi:hypothetical protein